MLTAFYRNIPVLATTLKALDKAKFLLVVADIQKHLNKRVEDGALSLLIKEHEGNNEHWKRIKRKHIEILKGEE